MPERLTPDDLVTRLRLLSCSSDFESYLGRKDEKRTRLPSKLPKRKDVISAFKYVNQRFCLGLDHLPFEYWFEDQMACLLHSLTNMPLAMIHERIEREKRFDFEYVV